MSTPIPFPLRAYSVITTLARPLVGSLLKRRADAGKEIRERLNERYGIAGKDRPGGPLIWFHAASVGETNAVLPLMHRISKHFRDVNLLLTTVTVTSAELAASRLPENACHQFSVLDTPSAVRQFLDHWQPGMAVFAESEIWPNTLMELHRRSIPAALINGRISERSYKRWRFVPNTIGWLLNAYPICLTQSDVDTRRFRDLGAEHAQQTGNVKFDVPAPQASAMDLAAFRHALTGRPVWAAASTHPGEDAIVLEAHLRVAEKHPNLLTLIAPRHPERGKEIAELAKSRNLQTSLRSVARQPTKGDQVFIFDSIGELGLMYRLAEVAFIGGSLAKRGGQNPIEPAKLETAILHGPYTFNFSDAYAALTDSGGAEQVDGPLKLASSVERLLSNSSARSLRARAAASGIVPLTGALERTFAALTPFVEQVRTNSR